MDKPRLNQGEDYECGFIDGMQYQRHSSVDEAVNAMSKRTWVGLTEEERKEIWNVGEKKDQAWRALLIQTIRDVETKLKERNT